MLLTILSRYSKSAGVPVLWFRASTCFRFWSKAFTKRCTNNSLLTRDKIISCLLELTGHVLSISECFGKSINSFRFWWKTYTKRCHVSKDFLPPHFAVGQLLSVSGDLENGRMPCKQKYCIKNMAVKIPILILFRFCLLYWLKNHLLCVLSVIATSCFSYISPFWWFWFVLDDFDSY